MSRPPIINFSVRDRAGDTLIEADFPRLAAVVRRWGTTAGLGQLAQSGPTADTRLDPCPTVRVHPLAIVATMDCAPWPL